MTKLVEISFVILIVSLLSCHPASASKKTITAVEPCKRLVLYDHDILFNGTDGTNATSAGATNATKLGNSSFGLLVVSDDPVTKDRNLLSPPVAKAQGFYFYDRKYEYNTWFAYTLVFNSSEHKGTINIMGADLMAEKTRDLSVVSGTGDFFMTRGLQHLKPMKFKGCVVTRHATAFVRLTSALQLSRRQQLSSTIQEVMVEFGTSHN